MKTRKFIAIAMTALMSLAACKKVESDTPKEPAEDLKLKVTASLYQFTKATDTAFEENDAIGLYMFNPETYAENVKYTVKNGALTTANDIVWYDNKDLQATITAYYPYNDNAYNGTFTVNADQSTMALYKASDLMLATTVSKPVETAVVLPFKHALSKIVVNIYNKLAEDITEVYFTNILGKVTFDVNNPATVAAAGTEGTIKAYKNGNTWQLIVAPQTASPKLAITTASGKQYTFILSDNVTFTSGKVSSATVEVSPESIYTAFTPEIEDWTADNELNFSQEETDTPVNPDPIEPEDPETTGTIIYLQTNPNGNWAQSNPRFAVYSWDESGAFAWTDMNDINGDLIYKAVLPEGHTNLIFCRMNPATNENRWNIWEGENKDTDATKPIWNQSEDLTLPTDGANCYVVADDAWDKGQGTWKTIEAND